MLQNGLLHYLQCYDFMEYLLNSDGTQENLSSCFDGRMNHFDNFGKL